MMHAKLVAHLPNMPSSMISHIVDYIWQTLLPVLSTAIGCRNLAPSVYDEPHYPFVITVQATNCDI